MSRHRLLAAVLLYAVFYASISTAQNLPARPLRIIVPYAPGGTSDVIARELASRAGSAIGQQILVENRAGAAGMIGAELLARSPADGATLGMLATPHAATPFVTKLAFDPASDLTAVTQVMNVPGLLSVHAGVAATTLAELVALARSRPGQLTYGQPGNLSSGHLAMESFKAQAALDIVAVSYKGGGAAIVDLLAGNITMMVSGPTAHLPHIATGKLRAIAVTSAHRSSALPNVPTVAESGFDRFDESEWYGLFAPAKTPPELIRRWHAELSRVIQMPEVRQRFASLGAEPVGSSPEAFAAFFKSEMDKYGRLVRTLGLKAE